MNSGELTDRIQELTGDISTAVDARIVFTIARRVLSEIHSETKCSERMMDVDPASVATEDEVVCNMPLDFLSLQCIWNLTNKTRLQAVNGFLLKSKMPGWRNVKGEPICYYYTEMRRNTSYKQIGLWPLLDGLDDPLAPTSVALEDPEDSTSLPELQEG